MERAFRYVLLEEDKRSNDSEREYLPSRSPEKASKRVVLQIRSQLVARVVYPLSDSTEGIEYESLPHCARWSRSER